MPILIEEKPQIVPAKYAVCVALTCRVRDLDAGKKPRIDENSDNPVSLALEELAHNRVAVDDATIQRTK